jgi:Taurine catabolism dioxygenase TauD, TfdA family
MYDLAYRIHFIPLRPLLPDEPRSVDVRLRRGACCNEDDRYYFPRGPGRGDLSTFPGREATINYAISELGRVIGTEVRIDPAVLVDGSQGADLRRLLEARGVLVFRRINLSDDQQVRVASSLGTVREEAGFRLKRTPWYGPIAPAASRSCSARTPRMSKGSNLQRAAQLCIARRWSAKRLSLEAALAVGAAYSGQYNGCKRKICAGTRAP